MLRLAKLRMGPQPFEWYPYESLSGLQHLEKLLAGDPRPLRELIGDAPVLDIGCADGEMSFFFESLGYRVHAIDHRASNQNHMMGVRALKQAFESRIEISEIDLDSQFVLPGERYGLALFLGTLYHLKNPFYVLDALSRQASRCLLSTRIARSAGGMRLEPLPVAYLVDEDELNADDSNFWIFTEAGLRRLLKRTNWDVEAFITVGDRQSSDPVSAQHDERAFCLVRSRWALANVELLRGWHAAEEAGWRWTAREFSFRAPVPAGDGPAVLKMSLYVNDRLFETAPEVRLEGSVSGERLAVDVWRAPGRYVYERRLPRPPDGYAEFEFALSAAIGPEPADPRELGLVVASIRCD